MVPDKVFTNIDEMLALLRKQIELYGEMKRALLIANLIGIPPKDIKGKMTCGVYTNDAPPYARHWRTQELVVRLDGVEVVRKKMIDVPLDLWPDDVRIEYERHQKRNKAAVMRGA